MYLCTDRTIGCGKFAEGAHIGVSLHLEDRIFTSGYRDANPDEEPDVYFTSTDGYTVCSDGEYGEVSMSYREVTVPDPETTFVKWRDQIDTGYESLTGRNWMSGISGERYLNEINIPGTHDSATKDVDCLTTYKILARWAKTQVRYIDEQFDDGVRWIDVRLNNYGLIDGSEVDDGYNLYLCHGKTAAGTFYGQDRDGKSISLQAVIE